MTFTFDNRCFRYWWIPGSLGTSLVAFYTYCQIATLTYIKMSLNVSCDKVYARLKCRMVLLHCVTLARVEMSKQSI